MKNLKNTKGITLIALIITIIVLLILAGVTIATLTGDNGLLSKTAGAKEENFKGEEREKIVLGFNEYRIKKYTDANPQLTVEGATSVTPKDGGGWTVTFPSERVYEVEADGTITGGEIAGQETAGQETGTVASLAKAGVIKRGDVINYDPGTAAVDNTQMPAGTSLTSTMTTNNLGSWRVFDVNQETGEVLITCGSNTGSKIILTGMDGYNNLQEALDIVTSIYKNPTYASNSRSVTIEDFNRVANRSSSLTTNVEYSWYHRYGIDDNYNIIDAGEGNKPLRTYKRYNMTNLTNDTSISYGNSLGGRINCLVGSRIIAVTSSKCALGIRWLRI